MVPYDRFAEAFLSKISDYNLALLEAYQQQDLVDRFLHTACAGFARVCRYDLTDAALDDSARTLLSEIPAKDLGEIINILSDGMVAAWLNTYLYRQENLQNVLNTTDFSGYSPAELLKQIRAAHKQASDNFHAAMRRYSFDNADRKDFVI
jgi:hypothetical protein